MDANVLVSFLTDRDPAQQHQASELLGATVAGSLSTYVLQVVVVETLYVLKRLYAVEPARIAILLQDLMAMPGVAVVDDLPWSHLFEVWPQQVGDFADAALICLAKRKAGTAVATFDRRLARRLHRLQIPLLW